MANSDVEADEWAESLSKLILYRKDDAKSLSLRRVPSSPTHTETMGTISERPRTQSDSYMPSHHTQSHAHPKSLTIPTPTHHPHHHTTDTVFHFSHSPHTTNLSHSLPTPPEMTMSPPIPQYYPPNMQRQRSNEFVVSLPSPSTSSDSSSMCSGSNASFDTQALFEGDKSDTSKRAKLSVCFVTIMFVLTWWVWIETLEDPCSARTMTSLIGYSSIFFTMDIFHYNSCPFPNLHTNVVMVVYLLGL